MKNETGTAFFFRMVTSDVLPTCLLRCIPNINYCRLIFILLWHYTCCTRGCNQGRKPALGILPHWRVLGIQAQWVSMGFEIHFDLGRDVNGSYLMSLNYHCKYKPTPCTVWETLSATADRTAIVSFVYYNYPMKTEINCIYIKKVCKWNNKQSFMESKLTSNTFSLLTPRM